MKFKKPLWLMSYGCYFFLTTELHKYWKGELERLGDM